MVDTNCISDSDIGRYIGSVTCSHSDNNNNIQCHWWYLVTFQMKADMYYINDIHSELIIFGITRTRVLHCTKCT